MNRQLLTVCILTATLTVLPATAFADGELLGAPDVTVMMDGHLFGDQGNLNAIANAGVISNYWEEGDCPDDNGSYHACDALRFGASKFNQANCSAGRTSLVEPKEDGGGDVESLLIPPSSNHIDYCPAASQRHLAEALEQLGDETFPGGVLADEDTQDQWFERPNLNLTILEDAPRPENDQWLASLEQACSLFEGDPGEIPPMPTWVVTVDEEVLPFAGMLAAAGGTGHCCDRWDNGGCDPVDDSLDVCEHIQGSADSQLRADIDDGRYNCQEADEESWRTGAAYVDGGQMHWRCILDANHEDCGPAHTATDLFGRFSCIRQVPREAYGGSYSFRMWDDDAGEFVELTEDDYEYIDDDEMLIAIGDTACAAGEIIIDPCPRAGENCQYTVDGQPAPGRCGVGAYHCPEDFYPVCEQQFRPMPEVCDGLDNSCDGSIDNISETWAKWRDGESDGDQVSCGADGFVGSFCFDQGELEISDVPGYPDEIHEGAACYEQDVCACSGGSDARYVGMGEDEEQEFYDYIRNWNPDAGCQCRPD